MWGIPMDTHSDLLVPMCNSIPLFYELCRRNCINSLIGDSLLVRSIAVHGVYFGRMSSPVGRNAQVCCERFNSGLCNFSQFSSTFIISKVLASIPDDRKTIVELVCELCFLHDGTFWLPTSFLTTVDVNTLISNACRM